MTSQRAGDLKYLCNLWNRKASVPDPATEGSEKERYGLKLFFPPFLYRAAAIVFI